VRRTALHRARSNSGTGTAANVASGSLGVVLDIDVSNCPIGLTLNASAVGRVYGTLKVGGQVGIEVLGGTANDLLVDLVSSAASTTPVYVSGSSTRARVRGHVAFTIAGSVTGSAVTFASGQVAVDNFTADGSGAGTIWTGITTSSGSTLRLGQNVNVSACATPFSIAGYCSKSLGSAAPNNPVAVNGVTAQTVTWPDLKSTERVFLSMHTKGGTPSALPFVTYTPGTSFSITSYALDTSTYDYEVR
jgi:hypothetical protein